MYTLLRTNLDSQIYTSWHVQPVQYSVLSVKWLPKSLTHVLNQKLSSVIILRSFGTILENQKPPPPDLLEKEFYIDLTLLSQQSHLCTHQVDADSVFCTRVWEVPELTRSIRFYLGEASFHGISSNSGRENIFYVEWSTKSLLKSWS